MWMRKTYGIAMIALHRDGETLREGDDIRSIPGRRRAGRAHAVGRPGASRKTATSSSSRPSSARGIAPAQGDVCRRVFAIALGLVLFSDLRLSVALLTGAMGMILPAC